MHVKITFIKMLIYARHAMITNIAYMVKINHSKSNSNKHDINKIKILLEWQINHPRIYIKQW